MSDFTALKIIVQVQVRPQIEDQNLEEMIQKSPRMVATHFCVDPSVCSKNFRDR